VAKEGGERRGKREKWEGGGVDVEIRRWGKVIRRACSPFFSKRARGRRLPYTHDDALFKLVPRRAGWKNGELKKGEGSRALLSLRKGTETFSSPPRGEYKGAKQAGEGSPPAFLPVRVVSHSPSSP